ncbi:MAG: NADH-quinone oxidoreductase subunit J [Prevotellaceae bacterium]|jgi:NADH-quinone oxidoreductase subunit J|nr:NADH-quinone oxidoreductase subunit J [Prevotellaceae bacterium]
METSANTIIFYILGAIIVLSSIMAVAYRGILRATTFLLFVLIGTAGLYFLLDYHFLAAVQLSIYVGGILVLFIFAILLTSRTYKPEPRDKFRVVMAVMTVLTGIAVTVSVLFKHRFLYSSNPTIVEHRETDMKIIGKALTGADKYQYLLAFEVMSILLLVCVIAGILIARKR